MKIQTKIGGVLLLMFVFGIRCTQENPVTPQSLTSGTVGHSENITQSETWTADKVHNVVSALVVKKAVLRIEPGTKVTFEQNASLSISDSAGLFADGSQGSIIFTSLRKNKGDWNYIYFSGNARDDSCKLMNCTIEYGGGDSERKAMIYVENAAPAISGCSISSSSSNGVVFFGDCRQVEFHSNTISDNDAAPVESFAMNVSFIGSNEYVNNASNFIRITDGAISFNTNWYRHEIPYLVVDELEIKSAKLILHAGVEMHFNDAGIMVSEGGSLHADGEFAPIIFSGEDAGTWNGILITNSADDASCVFNNCVIENGGRNARYPANLILENASPDISNCTVQNSVGYGIYIEGDFAPRLFSNTVVTGNSIAPFSVSANDVSNIPFGSYTGNGEDVIEVRGAPQSPPVTEHSYWQNLGIPYKVKNTVQILGCDLTLASGVTVLMAEQSRFEVAALGGFIAEGVSSKIYIKGAQPVMGYWDSIYFGSSANADNCRLVNCEISFGGGNSSQPGMVYCDRLAPTIRNCILEFSQTWGIFMSGNVTIVDLQSNVFSNNGLGDYYSAP